MDAGAGVSLPGSVPQARHRQLAEGAPPQMACSCTTMGSHVQSRMFAACKFAITALQLQLCSLQVAEAVGGQHTAADCEALYYQHKGYLSLNKQFHMEIAWLAMVQDSLNAAPAKVCCTPQAGQTLHAFVCRCPLSTEVVLPSSACVFLVVLQGRSDKTPSDAGMGATGSIISGGTSTPQFASRGRRTPRNRLPDAETTPNSKVTKPPVLCAPATAVRN